MQFLYKFWLKQNTPIDVWFFYAFLITFPLSIRKVLYSYPIANQFNEYSGIYLYLSDIFIILILVYWIISRLYHKNYCVSMKVPATVPRPPCVDELSSRVETGGALTLLLPFLLLSVMSIAWSANSHIAFFRFFKIFEFIFLTIFIIVKIVPRGTILKKSFEIITTLALIQSIIGIWQFITQKSVGLFWLKESLIGPDILGVAKLIFDGEKFIRSYGLFPHPNVFGGFLLFSIIITYLHHKMFHVEQMNNSISTYCSTWNNKIHAVFSRISIVPRGTIILNVTNSYRLVLLIQFIALLLTFSKSAIIGLAMGIAYIFIKKYVPRGTKFDELLRIVPRGTILLKKLSLILIIILTSLLISKPDLYSFFFKSLDERMLYINVSRGTILDNPFLGSGIGQFVIDMQSYTNLQLLDWQFQPVHNVFLLIWSELGLIGLLLFIIFFWKLFHVEQLNITDKIKCSTWNNNSCEAYNSAKNVPRPPCVDEMSSRVEAGGRIENHRIISIASRGLLFGIIFIMLFDHYFWTIQQGQIILWLTIALAYSKKK